MSRLACALAAALIYPAVLVGAPSLVAAHALVLESSPRSEEVLTAPPSQIVFRFNSRIEKALSRVSVTGPAGRPIPLPVVAPDRSPNQLVVRVPALAPGRYVVRWKVLSADGHVTAGVLRFTLAP